MGLVLVNINNPCLIQSDIRAMKQTKIELKLIAVLLYQHFQKP